MKGVRLSEGVCKEKTIWGPVGLEPSGTSIISRCLIAVIFILQQLLETMFSFFSSTFRTVCCCPTRHLSLHGEPLDSLRLLTLSLQAYAAVPPLSRAHARSCGVALCRWQV